MTDEKVPQKKPLLILLPWWSQDRGSQLATTRDIEDQLP